MICLQEVSEACQINDLDHVSVTRFSRIEVSEACQINDLDHDAAQIVARDRVSEACQINDLDRHGRRKKPYLHSFRSLSDQ